MSQAMRIALPLFGSDIAPRFCFAREMLVVDLVEGKETSRRHVMFGHEYGPQRIRTLSEYGVKVILCSGFNRHFLPLAQESGIEVVWGLQGDIEDLIERFLSGKLKTQPRPYRGSGCKRRRRRRSKSRGAR